MARIPGFHYCGPGSIPGQGTEIPQSAWQSQKKKEKKKGTILQLLKENLGNCFNVVLVDTIS